MCDDLEATFFQLGLGHVSSGRTRSIWLRCFAILFRICKGVVHVKMHMSSPKMAVASGSSRRYPRSSLRLSRFDSEVYNSLKQTPHIQPAISNPRQAHNALPRPRPTRPAPRHNISTHNPPHNLYSPPPTANHTCSSLRLPCPPALSNGQPPPLLNRSRAHRSRRAH